MTGPTVTGYTRDTGDRAFLFFVTDDVHVPYKKLKEDFGRLGLAPGAHGGQVAFGEFYEVFLLAGEKVCLIMDSDSGEIYISADNQKIIDLLVHKLSSLGGYSIDSTPSA
ncbi:hypothetical protein [Dyella japonica]|uniref:Uncharacterized protein n=1 Tax=Dyella japonica A8 TaxID=1217721 RepID=A0A075JV60_9GAMM|nr:hypothetical protein [Dyella japonica]AIF45991.1 hypothetical protein HY57_01275 [Dyella japonica A8]